LRVAIVPKAGDIDYVDSRAISANKVSQADAEAEAEADAEAEAETGTNLPHTLKGNNDIQYKPRSTSPSSTRNEPPTT
jgi:hypothetical protein